MLSEEQQARLEQPLDASLVKQRDGYQDGKKKTVSYIAGETSKRHANEIFGFDGWSYELVKVQEVYAGDHIDRKTKEVKGRKVSYTAEVRVRAMGIVREDAGYGSGYAQDDGDATEGAIKEAVTDGLKKALVSFGDQFGLGLYGGGNASQRQEQAHGQQQEPPQQEPTFREWFDGQIGHYRTALGADFDAEVKRRGVGDLSELKKSGDAKALIAGLKNEVDKRAAR